MFIQRSSDCTSETLDISSSHEVLLMIDRIVSGPWKWLILLCHLFGLTIEWYILLMNLLLLKGTAYFIKWS
jgi:hypothetical protein